MPSLTWADLKLIVVEDDPEILNLLSLVLQACTMPAFLFCFESGSHYVPMAGLELIMYTARLFLNSEQLLSLQG